MRNWVIKILLIALISVSGILGVYAYFDLRSEKDIEIESFMDKVSTFRDEYRESSKK